MSQQSAIEWTEATWNPWYGCAKVSPGCENCYMFTEMKRYGRDPQNIKRALTTFFDPLKWVRTGKAPKYCFTCSWSDFFINAADPWRPEAWEIISGTRQITYQILTKRIGRVPRCLPPWWGSGLENVWLGPTVENRAAKQRITGVRSIPARVRMLSCEPLLEDLGELDLSGIHWVIVGGESGPHCRPMDLAWPRSIRDQCRAQGVAFFMKQLGGRVDKRGKLEQLPPDLKIREYPARLTH